LKGTARRKAIVAAHFYTGIRVRDLNRSLRFYTKVMGMKQILRGRMKAGGIFIQLRSPRSKQRLELNYYPAKTKYHERYCSGSELDHLAFWTRDVDDQLRRIVSKGGKIAVSPFSENGYRLAFVKDPDGIWIELMGRDRKKGRL